MSSKARVSGTLALTIVLTIGFTVSGFALGNAKETGKRESVAAKVASAADDADCRWSTRANDQIDGLTALLIYGPDRREFLHLAAEPRAASSASDDDLLAVTTVSVNR